MGPQTTDRADTPHNFKTRFDAFVCVGDTLETFIEGFTLTARIAPDMSGEPPDARQDGFWPSLYKDAPGFIGAGNGWRERYETQHARAQSVMDAWRKDEWFYCGIVLSVSRGGVILETHAASLWGIEANYPDADNSYLSEVADELLPEALQAARGALATLCAGCGYSNAVEAA